jgi:hypothetical protein
MVTVLFLNLWTLIFVSTEYTPRIHDHLLLDSAPNIGPLISRWELDKFRNCWNKSFRTSKILTLLYQQSSNLLISQQDMNGPRLGALSNNRWSGGTILWQLYLSFKDSEREVQFEVFTCHVTIRKRERM